ncbi:MAG: hypothetical protein AAF191_17630 [Verrucomicrobiota bacterium]
MGRWSPDLELELACKLGALLDFDRAVEEGADPNWDGGAPLFLAIMNSHEPIVRRLIHLGADPSPFLPKAKLKKLQGDETAIVAALCAGFPPPVEEAEDDGHQKEESLVGVVED